MGRVSPMADTGDGDADGDGDGDGDADASRIITHSPGGRRARGAESAG